MADEAMNAVEVRYRPDDEDMVRLYVRVRFDGFEGRGEAWVDRQELSEFAERLAQYPLDDDNPVTYSAGLGATSDYIEFVGLSASPVGGKGQVVITVHVAAERWDEGEPKAVHQATIEFPTSYEFLRRFSRHVRLVVDGALEVATLDPDVLN